MAMVMASASVGGSLVSVDADTVGDVRKHLELDSGHVGSVNGVPQDDDYELESGEIVTFAVKTKGGI